MKKNNKIKNYAYNNQKSVELKPIDEVKAFFRNYFKEHSSVGTEMGPQEVKKHILKYLTAKEDAVFTQALNDLVNEGFIDKKSDGVTLVLTQKGSDSF